MPRPHAPKLTADDLKPRLTLDDRRIHVDAATGHIAVRVANFDEHHSAFSQAVRSPKTVNLEAAHVGAVDFEDGTSTRVATLPMHTTHAPGELQAMHASSWYENTGKAIARGRYSQDETGIRFDGMLFTDVAEADLDRITASGGASGDWRTAVAIKQFSEWEHTPADFVGSCIVNVGGFSDTLQKKVGRRLNLTASGIDIVLTDDAPERDNPLPATITAGSVGSDGLSEQDVRDAWREEAAIRYPRSQAGTSEPSPMDSDHVWVNEFYVAPQKIIVGPESYAQQIEWGVAPDGTIVFGAGVSVEKVWIEKEVPMQDVTLTASALQALIEAAGEGAPEARDEAAKALVASGAVAAPDPIADLSARVELLAEVVAADVFSRS